MRAEDPEGAGRGTGAIEWGSDAMAELLHRLDLRYIALVPGSSYRGLHDSLVNYAGNRDPQLLTCLHEEHALSHIFLFKQISHSGLRSVRFQAAKRGDRPQPATPRVP